MEDANSAEIEAFVDKLLVYDLDELVYSAHSVEASLINNSGKCEQLEYLQARGFSKKDIAEYFGWVPKEALDAKR